MQTTFLYKPCTQGAAIQEFSPSLPTFASPHVCRSDLFYTTCFPCSVPRHPEHWIKKLIKSRSAMSLSCLYDSIQSSTTDCQEKKNTYQRLFKSVLLKANDLFFSEYNFIIEHLFSIIIHVYKLKYLCTFSQGGDRTNIVREQNYMHHFLALYCIKTSSSWNYCNSPKLLREFFQFWNCVGKNQILLLHSEWPTYITKKLKSRNTLE